MPILTYYLRRLGRWLRRTRWMAREIAADLGLREPGGPAWLRDNPFLTKTSKTELRRFSLGWRLAVAVCVLGGLLLGGLWVQRAYPAVAGQMLLFFLGARFPAALVILLSFAHIALIANARTALTVSIGDEARRATLPDLLLTPLRRAEMLLAMAVGPARTAFLVALAGLPIYALLAEFGGLSWKEIGFLYILFALLSFVPPSYALPALSGQAATPDAPLRLSSPARKPRPMSRSALSATAFSFLLGGLFMLQILGLFGGGWLSHLMLALHLTMGRAGPFSIVFGWPYYVTQILGGSLDFFHHPLPPLLYVLPLVALNWAAGALESASALSAGDAKEMRTLPIYSRARTLARWVARTAGLFALGVVWKAWVESGDTATLAGGAPGLGGWDAAGLALLLGGFSLPNVCHRALAAGQGQRRLAFLVLRRAFKRGIRPLGVAALTFLLACALGGLSPLAPAVYETVGRIAAAGLVSILWAVGVQRVLPGPASARLLPGTLLYVLPMAALSAPIPGLDYLAALSPASAWVRLVPEGAGLLQRFPFWHIGLLPPFPICMAGAGLTGLALVGFRKVPPSPAARVLPPKRWEEESERTGVGAALSPPTPPLPAPGGVARSAGVGSLRSLHNAAQTAALMAWITACTDNPLFTYEMRTRTRSGRWADWRYFVPAGLFAAILLAFTYPDVIGGFTFLSPFHFFGIGGMNMVAAGETWVWTNLASLLLAGQVYFIGFRGQGIGESLIARDRQRGIWGFILLTPLSSRQIFWGKLFGQTSGYAVVWAALGLCSFLLYALAVPAAGFGPVLIAWLTGQFFVAAVFLLGLGLGAALATQPIFLKSLRGASTLVFVGLVGGGIYWNLHVWDFNQEDSWQLMTARLLLGSGYALGLAVPLLAFAEWRLRVVRNKDIPFGDGVE